MDKLSFLSSLALLPALSVRCAIIVCLSACLISFLSFRRLLAPRTPLVSLISPRDLLFFSPNLFINCVLLAYHRLVDVSARRALALHSLIFFLSILTLLN